jgi:RNA polymerase sigma-70 factor (ECF subfamily)
LKLKFSATLALEREPDAEVSADDAANRLIRLAQDGDSSAYDRIVEQHQTLCYHVALQRVRDPEMAVECCQEAVISAWRRLDSFSGDARSFRSWLLRIVVNACIDRLRYESRRPSTVSLDAEPDDGPKFEPPAAPGTSIEDLAERGELRTRLRTAIQQVPDPYRATLELHLCELTYAEIASTLGIDMGTVSSRLARARGHLRANMVGPMDHGSAGDSQDTDLADGVQSAGASSNAYG